MALSIAVQMDHINTVRIAGDTTFALCLEAQRRGHKLFHYPPDRLSMRDGIVGGHEQATVTKTIRRNIQNAHDERSLTNGHFVVPNLQQHRS